MNEPRWSWVPAAVLLACVYGSVGILFALPTTHLQAWRLAAWIVSAAAFGSHIGFERLRLHSPPLAGALHVALAAALGAFVLAAGALVHAVVVGTGSHHQRLLLLALLIWPVITGLPAFLVALVASWILGRLTFSSTTR